jgi:hypothetical protein
MEQHGEVPECRFNMFYFAGHEHELHLGAFDMFQPIAVLWAQAKVCIL